MSYKHRKTIFSTRRCDRMVPIWISLMAVELAYDLFYKREIIMNDSKEKLIVGDSLQVEGTIIKQGADISRDAVVIKTDDGDEAVVLEQNTTKIING